MITDEQIKEALAAAVAELDYDLYKAYFCEGGDGDPDEIADVVATCIQVAREYLGA